VAWTIRGDITGLAGVLGKLARLASQTTRSKILRKAVDVATRPILQAARAGVPQRTGFLKRSLKRTVKTYRSSGTVVALIGPGTGYRRQLEKGRGGRLKVVSKKRERLGGVYANPVRYAHLVELGTRRSRKLPFLAPAFARSRTQAAGTIRQLIQAGIAEALR
jgi:HK97 gp10 family phage protein